MVLEATDGVYCKAVMPLMYNSTKHWNMSNVEPNRNMLTSIFNNKHFRGLVVMSLVYFGDCSQKVGF